MGMHPYLVLGLEKGAQAMGRVVALIPDSSLDLSIAEGRFTPREVIAHLADWEPILRHRIEAALAQPGILIAVYDEEQMAIDHAYQLSNVKEQLALFIAERTKTVELVRSLNDADRLVPYQHPESGTMKVQDQIDMLLGHDLYHLEQLMASL